LPPFKPPSLAKIQITKSPTSSFLFIFLSIFKQATPHFVARLVPGSSGQQEARSQGLNESKLGLELGLEGAIGVGNGWNMGPMQ